MATEDTTQSATTSTENHKKASLRQLSGTSFLTLEHVGYFALVVLLPVLLLSSAFVAIQLWQSGSASIGSVMPLYILQPLGQYADTSMAINLTAALIVFAPLLYVLRRRVSSEYTKRSGFEDRVGYKLPVYTALAVLTALTTGALAAMLGIFLNSLVNIGVNGAHIGQMYSTQFLPALLAFAILGMAAWYTLWFAKGKDTSRMFVGVVGVLAAVMAVTLLVTALTLNHENKSVNPLQPQTYPLQDNSNNYLQY